VESVDIDVGAQSSLGEKEQRRAFARRAPVGLGRTGELHDPG
jgi:hypothetical protein